MMGKTGTQKGFDSFLKEARKMAKLGGIPGVVGVNPFSFRMKRLTLSWTSSRARRC